MTMVWKISYRASLWVMVAALTGVLGFTVESNRLPVLVLLFPAVLAETGTDPDADIQWFRDQMAISEQYTEAQEGVSGMSWAHFFTMVFLVIFALGALALYIQRQRRTREILELIRKEMEDGNSDRV